RPIPGRRRGQGRGRRLQHGGPRGRRGAGPAPGGRRGGGGRRARRGPGHARQGGGRAPARGGARSGAGKGAAGFRQEPDRSLQISAGDRVRRGAAANCDGQAAAVPAARTELSAAKPAVNRALSLGIVGGGPAGLYLATLVKLLTPKQAIEVWERTSS